MFRGTPSAAPAKASRVLVIITGKVMTATVHAAASSDPPSP